MTTESDHVDEMISSLSDEQGVAFAIACVERVLPFTDWYYGVRQRPMFDKARELCWDFALGKPVDEEELESTQKHFDELADELYEEDEDGSPYLFVVLAVYFAIQSVMDQLAEDPDSDAAHTSIGHSRSAAFGEDEHRFHDEHMQEEAVWQAQAIDLLVAAPQLSRDMFAQLPTNPKWLQSFVARKPPRSVP